MLTLIHGVEGSIPQGALLSCSDYPPLLTTVTGDQWSLFIGHYTADVTPAYVVQLQLTVSVVKNLLIRVTTQRHRCDVMCVYIYMTIY